MGVNVSKTSSEQVQQVLNTAISQAVIDTAQSCSSAQNVSQTVNFDIEGSKTGDINILATQTADISCIQGSSAESSMQKNIQSALQSAVQQQSTAGSGFFSIGVSSDVSSQRQTLINNISNNLKISNVKNAIATQSGQQVVNGKIVNSSTGNVNVSIQGTQVLKAVQSDSSISNDVTSLANSLSTQGSQTATSGFNMNFIFIIIAVIISLSCSGGAYWFFSKPAQPPQNLGVI